MSKSNNRFAESNFNCFFLNENVINVCPVKSIFSKEGMDRKSDRHLRWRLHTSGKKKKKSWKTDNFSRLLNLKLRQETRDEVKTNIVDTNG
jgi:hypothetical protein